MPRPHIAMRKIRDVLRLRLGEGLSMRQVSASTRVPIATVYDYVRRAQVAGLGWPLPDEFDDDALVPEEVRVANRIMKNAGFVPPAVEHLRAIVQRRTPPAQRFGHAEVV